MTELQFQDDVSGGDALPETEATEPVVTEPAKPVVGFPEATSETGAPDWCPLPKGLRFPRGIPIMFLRIRAALTETPWKGDRAIVMWQLSLGDKRIAIGRCNGDVHRLTDELLKVTIHAVDGRLVDNSGTPDSMNVDLVWSEIGEKGRSILQRAFTQLNVVSPQEVTDFFENCVAVRIGG